MTHSYSGLQTWRQIIYRLQILFLLFCFSIAAAQTTVIFHEDFEGDWTTNWHADAGTWEAGEPVSGPSSAYEGTNCAATVLDGNYTTSVSSRFIMHTSIIIPEALEYPRLRFQQWYSFAYHDYGKVQIKVDGTSDWFDISCQYNNTGGEVWTYPSIDLSDYAGQSVQIAFYFYSETVNNSTGWYIDDVEVVTGMQKFNNPESWERGIGDWASERGAWEIGVPTSGPGSAYEGVNCAATVLSGNYTTSISSRLISPVFNVPATSENPVLRFQHWYSFAYHDYGKVQVKVEGTSEWNDIADGYFNNTGGSVWTYTYFPISEYSNQSVQIGFLMYSETVNNSTGWYIDDIFIQGLTTDLDKKVDEQNSGFLKNAPNPFSSTTQISYVIINTEHVYLRVYNELGQIVATLVNRVQEPGKHSVDFDSSGLPSGIYFYQLQCGNTFSDTKKMIKAVK